MITDSKFKSEQISISIYLSDKDKYSIKTQELITKYLNQLDDKEQTAYLIAKEHLGTSFDIVKSIGYVTWLKNHSDS